MYGFGCNFSYPDKGDPNGLLAVKNITISKLWFKGTSDTDGFFEHKHLINLNGVKDVLIRDCSFSAFNGDAIYIGSGVEVEKHNKNVSIIHNYFDGVNKQNRNAISVIDGDCIIIDSNHISNCTRTDMPGAIDIEPDKNRYHIIRNISITNNHICDIGGNVSAITVFLPLSQHELNTPVFNIDISGNTIIQVMNGIGVYQRNEATAQSKPHNLTITNNKVIMASGYPLGLYGVRNVDVVENTFDRFKTNIYLGLPPAKYQVYNVRFTRNKFIGNNHDGVAISLRAVEDFISQENTLEDIGLANGNYGIAILGETKGKTKSIQSIRDTIVGNRTTSFSEENPGHQTVPALNKLERNANGNNPKSRFLKKID